MPTENLAAYEAYLIGKQRFARRSTDGITEAIDYFRKAAELDPMSASLRRSYAVSLREVGRIEEALEQLEIVLEIDPNFAEALDAIATIQWQVFNRLDKAVHDYVWSRPETDLHSEKFLIR